MPESRFGKSGRLSTETRSHRVAQTRFWPSALVSKILMNVSC